MIGILSALWCLSVIFAFSLGRYLRSQEERYNRVCTQEYERKMLAWATRNAEERVEEQ